MRALIASRRRVAAALSNNVSSPFVADDALLVLHMHSSSDEAEGPGAVLNRAFQHFGHVDVVVNSPADEQPGAQIKPGEWNSAYALAERIFWTPLSITAAVCAACVIWHDDAKLVLGDASLP